MSKLWINLALRFKSNYFWFLGGAFVGAGFNFYTNIFQFQNSPGMILYVTLSATLWILAGLLYTMIAWHIEDVNQQVRGLSEDASEMARKALFRTKRKILSISLALALVFTLLGFLLTWLPIILR